MLCSRGVRKCKIDFRAFRSFYLLRKDNFGEHGSRLGSDSRKVDVEQGVSEGDDVVLIEEQESVSIPPKILSWQMRDTKSLFLQWKTGTQTISLGRNGLCYLKAASLEQLS